MRRRLSFLIGGLLLALALGFYKLPARLLPAFLDPDLIRISGVSGHLLDGSATRAVVLTDGGPLHLGTLRWRFEPGSLFTLTPSLHLRSEWGSQRIELRLGKSGEQLSMTDLDAGFDAALVRQFAPLAVDGRLSLLFDELSVTGGRFDRAVGRIVWQDAAWLGPRGARALGTYAGDVTTDDTGTAHVEVTTIEGPLFASGTADLSVHSYATDIRLAGSDGPLDPDISQALSLLASPEDNGYRLRLNGDLNPGL